MLTIKSIETEPLAGAHIHDVAVEMVALASALDTTIFSTFNETTLSATKNTDPAEIVAFYRDRIARTV